MIVTEDEARYKACPFAVSFNASRGRQFFHREGASANETDRATCTGSSCMAWEFITPEEEAIFLTQAQKTFPEIKSTVEITPEMAESVGWYKSPRIPHGFARKYQNPERVGQCGRIHIVEISGP